MYPNFPRQVMEMSEARLHLNALFHYLTNPLPSFQKQERTALDEATHARVIDLGSREDFESIFTRLAAAKTSLSDQDKEDLAWTQAQRSWRERSGTDWRSAIWRQRRRGRREVARV